MKDKDIKKMLAQNSRQILPDESVKESIKSRLGYGGEQQVKAVAGGGTEKSGLSRRTIITICAAALAIIIAACIILPALFGRQTTMPPLADGENKFEEITDAQSFYAYGAASLGSILSTPESGGASAVASVFASGSGASAASSLTANGNGATERLGEINKYMALIESLLSDGAIESAVESDKGGYDCAMTITSTDILGNSVSYVMYYNRTFTGGETDGNESEENYSIEGVLAAGDKSYPVEGVYSTQSESESGESEQESELELTAFTSTDRRSYIEVKQEHEAETEYGENELETEYVYRVYEDGELVSTTVIQYENEDGELEIAMSAERDGQRDELKFSASANDNAIYARGTICGEKVSFTVHVSEGSYRYEFSDGRNENFGRFDEDRDNRPQNTSLLTA